MFRILITHWGFVAIMSVLLTLAVVVVSEAMPDCPCEFPGPIPGMKTIHCDADCGALLECCACGIISSQCRCCPTNYTPDPQVKHGVGRAVCIPPEPPPV